MLVQVQTILDTAVDISIGLIGGLGDVATFMFSNPLTFLGIGVTLVGFVIGIGRRAVRH